APLLRHRLQAHRTGPEAGRPVHPTGSNSTRTGGVGMTKELAQRTERDPNGIDPHKPGAKLDAGKVEPELIRRGFARALLAVADVGSPQGRKPLSMAAQPEPIRQPSRFRQVEQKWVGMNTSRERFERESARLREQMARRKVERLKEMKINWQRIAL